MYHIIFTFIKSKTDRLRLNLYGIIFIFLKVQDTFFWEIIGQLKESKNIRIFNIHSVKYNIKRQEVRKRRVRMKM